MEKQLSKKLISEVFNNEIGDPYSFTLLQLSEGESRNILASLFEQLLIFDSITITTNRLNSALIFLIKELGINTVEQLIDRNFIKFMIWTPVIFTSGGRQLEDNTIDESVIYGQPPIAAGSFNAEDMDPENNIEKALSYFQFHRERKRIFTRKALNNYVIPNGMEFSTGAAKFIISAYENNNLETLGLPYVKDANQLDFDERKRLLELGHKVLETSILSRYSLKSYENYEHFEICKQNLINIGKAYNVSANTSNILQIENVPKLKELFLLEKLDFEDVFKIRYLSTAKYYRKWINEVGENSNMQEVSADYMNQIRGNSRYFETTGGKLVKTISMLTVGGALGAAIAGPVGGVIGLAASQTASEFGLNLLEELWLDDLLKGKNPSMFIKNLKDSMETKESD